MKFNFDQLSYADVQGYSLLKESRNQHSKKEHSERAGNLLHTLLTEPQKKVPQKDSVSDFYTHLRKHLKNTSQYAPVEDLASPSTQKRNLAINKNTADRHGRT